MILLQGIKMPSQETLIKKLYTKVNERNKEILTNIFLDRTYEDYLIFQAPSYLIDRVEKENKEFIQVYKSIKKEINRGFLNRLFKVVNDKNVKAIRIVQEYAKQSIKLTPSKILELIEKIYDSDIQKEYEIDKFEYFHKRMKGKEYRIHRLTGLTFKATLLGIDYIPLGKPFNIPKKSGLLIPKEQNIEIIRPDKRPKKRRRDMKKPIKSFIHFDIVDVIK